MLMNDHQSFARQSGPERRPATNGDGLSHRDHQMDSLIARRVTPNLDRLTLSDVVQLGHTIGNHAVNQLVLQLQGDGPEKTLSWKEVQKSGSKVVMGDWAWATPERPPHYLWTDGLATCFGIAVHGDNAWALAHVAAIDVGESDEDFSNRARSVVEQMFDAVGGDGTLTVCTQPNPRKLVPKHALFIDYLERRRREWKFGEEFMVGPDGARTSTEIRPKPPRRFRS